MQELLWDHSPSALVRRFLLSRPVKNTNRCIQVFRKLTGNIKYYLQVTILDSGTPTRPQLNDIVIFQN